MSIQVENPSIAIDTAPASELQTEIQQLKRFYILRDQSKVAASLEKHPFLMPLLEEAKTEIGKYFHNSECFLEVVTDPEAPEEIQLFALIPTYLEADEALDTLQQFDHGWWLDASDRAQQKLEFAVD